MELAAAKMVGAGLAVVGLGGVVGIGNIFAAGEHHRSHPLRGSRVRSRHAGICAGRGHRAYALLISFLILFT